MTRDEERAELARVLAAKLGVRELSMAHMVCNKPPRRDYLFGAWALTPATYALLYAPGGSGKSYLALTIVLTLALAGVRGAEYDPLGIDPKPAPGGTGWLACYVTGEDNDDEVWRRVHRLTKGMGPGVYAAAQRNVRVVSTQGVAPRVLITDSDFQDFLIAACSGSRIVVLDTLTRFHAAEENSNNEMAGVVACIERVAHDTGAPVLATHHCNKQAQYEGAAMTGLAIRGASCIRDNSRWALAMGSAGDGTLALIEDKHNDGMKHPAIRLRWTNEGTLERTEATTKIIDKALSQFTTGRGQRRAANDDI